MSASAQNHPMPSAVPDPPAICTGCPGLNAAGEPNASKPTFPYDSPISLHAGRFVDSSTTRVAHNGMRTVRAGAVRLAPARNRVYLKLGGAVGAYTLDAFFSGKLHQPMVAVNTLNTGRAFGGRNPYEKLAKPDRFFYAEAQGSGWSTSVSDQHEVLADFDADDRGYLYVATIRFGWGIVSDPGNTTGTLLPLVVQVTPDDQLAGLLSLRIGSTYYLYRSSISDITTRNTKLYDVTTPASPGTLATRFGTSNTFTEWSKYEAGQRVAFLNHDGHVRIYSDAGLIAGDAPLVDVTPSAGKQFTDLSFDENGNVWVSARQTSATPTANVLWKLTPSADGYTTATFDVYGSIFSPLKIDAAGGYVALGGRVPATPPASGYTDDLRLLQINGGVPQRLETGDFFRNYYHSAPAGYAQPDGFYLFFNDLRLVPQGAKTYLFYGAYGLGDVYELGNDARITSMSPLRGIPAGGTSVSIYGSGFAAGATVTFDDAAAMSSTFVSASQMTAVTPAHASASVNVRVSVPAAPDMIAPRQFTYLLETPLSLVATAAGTSSVSLSWTAIAGATFYQVSRRSPDGAWDVIGTPAGAAFDDAGRVSETTYLYRVRAGDASANFSDWSASDLATTMTGDSATITAGMPILAADHTRLRSRANAVRAAGGLPGYSFTHPATGLIRSNHILELQQALREGRTSLGLTTPSLSAVPSGAIVKAVHFNELLDWMR